MDILAVVAEVFAVVCGYMCSQWWIFPQPVVGGYLGKDVGYLYRC